MIYIVHYESEVIDEVEVILFASILQADEFGNFNAIKNFSDELEFVRFIYEQLDAHNPKLVSYNKNDFIPLLIQKGLKYNLSGYSLFEKNNMMLNKSKWENYTTRYSEHYNINLGDIISNFNSASYQDLEQISKSLSIPILDKGTNQETSQYKVIVVFIIFLKFEMLRGNILFSDYRYILEGLEQNFHEKEFFGPLIDFIANEQN